MTVPVIPPGVHVTYRRQYTRCNRGGCTTCAPGGVGHGPYWYAYWHEEGRLRSRYLGKQAPPAASVTPTAVATTSTPAKEETSPPVPTAPTLRVRALGGFAVWRNGQRIRDGEWRRRKAAALFKALLSAREYRLHRDQVAELLWPESDAPRADSNLRFTLHQLRSILDLPDATASYVVARGGHLILVAVPGRVEAAGGSRPEDWLDAAHFAAAAAIALTGEDAYACKAALAYYTGPYLPDDLYEDWVLPRAEELARLHMALVLHHARIVAKTGSANERIPAWQAVLDVDPCDEEAAYALMRAFAEGNRIAEALRVHAALTVALRAALDVSPAAAIERLRSTLLARRQTVDPGSANPSSVSPLVDGGSPGPLTNLPTAMTSFVGRLQEQAAVQELLLHTRLLTLTGIGGSGKTRLATHVASTMSAHFPSGIWLVELATLTDSAGVAELVAGAVGVPDPAPDKPLLAGLIQYLQGRHLLLLLDNCEHLLGACADLADALLNSCAGLRILATSRESLDVAGETTFRVPPLSMPALGLLASPDQLLKYEAVQLFVERARAHRPGFVLTARNAQAVNSICSRLDGLPLAIELAAARIRTLSVENIADRLDQRFQLLTGGPRTALPRHQTLRAALDWSYELLTIPEQALLRRLSVFTGGWTLEAAEAICAGEPIGNWEVLDALSMLVDKSMVDLDERDEGARYWLQETMRQYAYEKLMAGNEITQMHENHLAWCLSMAEEGAAALLGPDQFSWLTRLTVEHENLRAALSWSTAVETQRGSGPATGLRLAGALWRFWWMRGFPHEGRRWLELTLASAGSAPVHLRARALGGAGVLAADQGDYARARTLHEESLALWRSLGDANSVAGALNNLGSAVQQQGDYRAARLLHEESLALWRAHGDVPGIAGALNQLACIARDDQRDYTLAGTLLDESLTLRRSLGDARGIAISLNNLGLVACHQGDFKRARVLLEESLTLRRSLGDTRGIANSLGNMGRVAVGLGDLVAGRSLYRQSLALRRDQGDRRGIVECLEGLAMVAELEHEPIRATRLLGAAEALREEIGFPRPPQDRDMPDQLLVSMCLALGEVVFAATWAEGRALGLEGSIAYASESTAVPVAIESQASVLTLS